jgi:hypothetical protein
MTSDEVKCAICAVFGPVGFGGFTFAVAVGVSAVWARTAGVPLNPKQINIITPTSMIPYRNFRIWVMDFVFIAFPP